MTPRTEMTAALTRANNDLRTLQRTIELVQAAGPHPDRAAGLRLLCDLIGEAEDRHDALADALDAASGGETIRMSGANFTAAFGGRS
jgi:hypothetical protein